MPNLKSKFRKIQDCNGYARVSLPKSLLERIGARIGDVVELDIAKAHDALNAEITLRKRRKEEGEEETNKD